MIRQFIPPAKFGGRHRSLDMRMVGNAILYLVVGGIQWRMLSRQKGFAVLPRRWVVERTFAWFHHHRRLSKDYEAQLSTSETMAYIVMIRLMVRRLASS